jgi:predicted nuclease of predicted toxin-antitoxin system
MRFLVDESTGPYVARWLIEQGHQVFSVFEQARGLNDDAIIQKAFTENWILITNDKDFGEKVYRERRPHRGVILLRLDDERSIMKIAAVKKLLATYSVHIADQFVVVTPNRVRFAHLIA